MRSRAAVLLIAGIFGVACGGTGGSSGGTLSVFAAASLTDSFKALGQSFQKTHNGLTVQFNFAGSSTLVTQIEQGAKADVFASADTANMDKLKADGLTAGEAQVFAHNQLAIVVAPGNPKHIQSLGDLARPGIVYISAAPSVPAGKYALQALDKAGVKVTPKSLETDVKSVLGKVQLGEADAGIVYATDIRAAAGRVDGVSIPDADNVVATYPLAALKGSQDSDAANAFIAFVLSAEGQAILASYGFRPA